MTERSFNLVVPLAHEATAMRTTDTAGSSRDRSGAVSQLNIRPGDVESTMGPSPAGLGIRTSTTATRTTTTATTSSALVPSADWSAHDDETTSTSGNRDGRQTSHQGKSTVSGNEIPGGAHVLERGRATTRCSLGGEEVQFASHASHHEKSWPAVNQPADFTFQELVRAYFDCRRTKRNSASALAFEERLEHNLRNLYDELHGGSYTPGRSICFVITRPKAREVWAATFRDRIVHHLLHNRIAPRFYARFIADSCACIPGRGTMYAAERLESKIRSITHNWSRPAHYLKCDLANFFVAIDKRIVRDLLARHIGEPYWMALAETILFHDPRKDFEYRGDPSLLQRVPGHKRLASQPAHCGLPIGNLSSQFFANVYLDVLDQYVKHGLRCRHYIRYVDDFVLLHESPQWLNDARHDIEQHLDVALAARLNPKKTILQPIERGIDFVGQVIKPWRRTLRRRTFNEAINRTRQLPADSVFETGNSYFGLLRQATHSHNDRAFLSNELRRRGHCIKSDLTKTYRRHK